MYGNKKNPLTPIGDETESIIDPLNFLDSLEDLKSANFIHIVLG